MRRSRLRDALRGYEVSEAISGTHLVEQLQTISPDLVVLDLSLRDVDGVRLLKLLKTTSATARIPVAVLATGPQQQAALVEGAEVAISPNAAAKSIAQTLTEALEQRARRKAPAVPERFERLRLIGVGGGADAYMAWDRKRGREVALKVFWASAQGGAKRTPATPIQMKEVELRLKHAGVHRVLGQSVTPSGDRILILDPGKGRPLRDVLAVVPPEEVLRSLEDTLRYLRRHKVAPRLVTPGTVLADADGQVKLDLGTTSVPRDLELRFDLSSELQYLEKGVDDLGERLLREVRDIVAQSGMGGLRGAPLDDKAGGGAPSSFSAPSSFTRQDTLHWNTRLSKNGEAAWPDSLAQGAEYDLETALETAPGPGRSVPIPAKEVPPGTKVVFEVRVEGGELRAGGQVGVVLRSEPLEVRETGTQPFRATLVPTSPSVMLRVDLCKGVALVASRVYRFEPGRKARELMVDGATPVEEAPALLVASGAFVAAEPIVRLDVQKQNGKFMLRVQSGPFVGPPIPAHRSAQELTNTAVRVRGQLVKLSAAYDPTSTEAAFEEFKKVGAEMHEAFFGHPDDAAVDPSLKQAAAAIADAGGRLPARMQIVAETLPFPWGVMYDARPLAPPAVGAPEADEAAGFWGARFRIDRCVAGTVTHAVSPILARRPLRVQSCINPRIDAEQKLEVVEAQRMLFKQIAEARPEIQAQPCIESREAFMSWLRGPAACELLYFFCHATSAQTVSDLFFDVGTAPEVQASLVLGESPGADINLQAMRGARIRALQDEPFVFMNACSSAAGDQAFQGAFLRHFTGTWRARGFLGTDWKVPTRFADEFARCVLRLFLEHGKTISEAIEDAARPLLAARNPFPLIYALYAQPNLRAS